ncbi:hypothetical protein M440DRAFT_1401216 [Trichoderma longibrachiatum ATCC 18648]|uniref:Uncharacterized protein n=1 Tax=Trichoderma longibrachiatum ATCC 18648 TaxID=983965 RepID=A0A2T4C5N3_TRILO|nr:hypothetical protein M440DRAFT_1401216 [Trichoderma longibrachiatum ATCC 18648]
MKCNSESPTSKHEEKLSRIPHTKAPPQRSGRDKRPTRRDDDVNGRKRVKAPSRYSVRWSEGLIANA